MSFYALHLFNIKQENPTIFQMLENRGISESRTGNAIAEVGVNMTLEQTINVSVKKRLQVIMNFADILTALNR